VPVLVMTAARATCASNPAGPSKTAVVPGECIGANPSHLLVAASLTRLTKRWARMTKAANPCRVRGLEGIRPVVLDRIPRRKRTQRTATCGGTAGLVRVLLADGRLPLREPGNGLREAISRDPCTLNGPRTHEGHGTTGALVSRIDRAGHEGARSRPALNRARTGGSRSVGDRVHHHEHPLPDIVNGPVDMDAAYVAATGRGNSFFCALSRGSSARCRAGPLRAVARSLHAAARTGSGLAAVLREPSCARRGRLRGRAGPAPD
jgi:hypothetical protein